MASWFYLYLYTEDKQRFTENITATIQKGSNIMSQSNMVQHNINIDEATSHWINVIAKNPDGTKMNLTGCHAIFTMPGIDKECLIDDNEINVKLEPEDTTGFLSSGYQIRLFDANDDVFQVIQGIIYIRKAHKPYKQKPLVGGE